jgi:pimeloyl-ACP methyl ester carboxylesterase
MPFYERDNLRLHYVCRGAAPSPSTLAIVFQHDLGKDLRQSSEFLVETRMCLDDGRPTIVHADFRAHGESDAGGADELTIESLAEDLIALLDHLRLDRAIVGGISLGAAVALRLAVRHPERCQAIVLCRPAWLDAKMNLVSRHALAAVADLLASDDWRRSAASSLERSGIPHYIGKVCPSAAQEIRAHVQSVLARPDSRQAAIDRLRGLPNSRTLDDAGELVRVRCPALILATHDDPLHPFDYATKLAAALPLSHLVELAPVSPHDCGAHGTAVDRAIGDFLRVVLHGHEGTCLYW